MSDYSPCPKCRKKRCDTCKYMKVKNRLEDTNACSRAILAYLNKTYVKDPALFTHMTRLTRAVEENSEFLWPVNTSPQKAAVMSLLWEKEGDK